MTKNEFIIYLKSNYPWLNENDINNILIYLKLVQDYNKHTNISNLCSDELIYSEFFLSSIIDFKNCFKSNASYKLLDIGSGAGIPGIALGLIYHNLEIYCLDSNSKKTKFLNHVKNTLDFKRLNVINDRAENYIKNNYEKFDFTTARAVSSLRNMIELCTPYTKINGRVLLPKSLKAEHELIEAKNIIKIMELKQVDHEPFLFNNKQHFLFEFIKTKPTDHKFPRPWNVIIKNPL